MEKKDGGTYPVIIFTKNPNQDYSSKNAKPNNIVVYPFRESILSLEESIAKIKGEYTKYF